MLWCLVLKLMAFLFYFYFPHGPFSLRNIVSPDWCDVSNWIVHPEDFESSKWLRFNILTTCNFWKAHILGLGLETHTTREINRVDMKSFWVNRRMNECFVLWKNTQLGIRGEFLGWVVVVFLLSFFLSFLGRGCQLSVTKKALHMWHAERAM